MVAGGGEMGAQACLMVADLPDNLKLGVLKSAPFLFDTREGDSLIFCFGGGIGGRFLFALSANLREH